MPSLFSSSLGNSYAQPASAPTIAGCFGRLITKIQPTPPELEHAQQYISTIKTRLNVTFKVRRPLVGGSYSRGTFIRGGSDVDLFAVIAQSDITWGGTYQKSETVLNHFRNELAHRYPNTPVGRDVQAVVVQFAQGPSVDVVPAVFHHMLNGRPQYLIPDGEGDWMVTSPERHNLFIREANERSQSKLRRVAQLVKFWRQCASTRFALSSFHIELLLASSTICRGVKSYAACLTEVLQLLAQRECRGLQDPLGISGLIPAVKTESQREEALASVRYARDHAKDACVADYAGDFKEAWRQWNIVFNEQFSR
jgi:predicted nucleotidyltransferase